MDNTKNNVNCAEKKSRVRGENWSQEEKDILIEIMRHSASVIENKQTDTNTNKKKNLEWVKIQNKLKELSGVHQDIPQLKGLWRRIKLTAKKTVSEHRRAVQGTGGGQKPPSPSQEDLTVMDLCPIDFVVDENLFDSDAVAPFISQDDIEKEHNSTVIYDVEIHEDIENGSNFIDVQDVQNKINEPKDRKVITEKANTKKKKLKVNTGKAAVVEENKKVKERAITLMEEEYAFKIRFQQQEVAHQDKRQKLELELLAHQDKRQKLELELLMLERQKKTFRNRDIKKKLQQWGWEIII